MNTKPNTRTPAYSAKHLILCLCLLFHFASRSIAPALDLQITNLPPDQLRFHWPTEAGEFYELKSIPELDAFALWESVSGAQQADSTNFTFDTALPSATKGFYRVFDLSAAYPIVRLTSHTNQQVVSGQIELKAFAIDDSRLSSVTFFVDDIPIADLTEGLLQYTLNTQHFSNGVHTIRVEARDNFGIGPLGGNDEELLVVNSAISENIQLIFTNAVRWVGAESLFETDVPIVVETDILPADWVVIVRNESNSVVRTFSDTTSTSPIVTSWDGLDQLGNSVPSDAAYEVEVQVSQGSSQFAAASSPEISGGFTLMGTEVNAFGVEEKIYVKIIEEKPTWQPVSLGITLWNAKTKEYEVIEPPKYEWVGEYRTHVLEKRVPVASLLSEPESGSMSALSSATSGAVVAPMWRESAWSSGQIVLARQQYRASLVGLTYNAALGQFMNQLAASIDEVAGNISGDRTTHTSSVFVMNTAGNYSSLLNAIDNSDVRALYYNGHANPEAIGFSELNKNDGITWREISARLGNDYLPALTNTSGTRVIPAKYRFRRPFNFVFMDGCQSANGKFPEAFGIPKDILTSQYGNKKRRAFMGWKTDTTDSIANPTFSDWSKDFWVAWLGISGEVDLGFAILVADSQNPTVAGQNVLAVYGNRELRWEE